jgi:hypothetical protein
VQVLISNQLKLSGFWRLNETNYILDYREYFWFNIWHDAQCTIQLLVYK